MGSLYALDFDGVLCDSCGESSISALKAAKERWPDKFSTVDPETETWILDNMRVVAAGLTTEGILENWIKLKPTLMLEWNESKDELVELFGKIRDEWIKHDLTSWIAANRFYPGTADALQFASSKLFIVTTKQTRFAEVLLEKLAGVSFLPDRIFGLGSGPKVDVLKELQNRPEHSGLELHFVEDRLATLQNVIKEPQLNKWNLYLGTWGYNTSKEREEASQISRIQLVDLPDFCSKLK
eukprot:TRINITY_DN1581_c0_g1_i4.p1 TRINITY_DN1581_c0_g1~~TRINITY_DN1581_c0_g1_i4.p1  ORF type:complete len:239 (+),score=60.79 TRINITY_DN1581_c0_g1_i4:254-970(+)